MLDLLNSASPLALAGGAAAAGAAAILLTRMVRRALKSRKARRADPLLETVSQAAAAEAVRAKAARGPDDLDRRAARKQAQVNWVLVPAMLCSGTLTFGGNVLELARWGGDGVDTTLNAAMIAIVVTALQWVSWSTALSLTPKMRSLPRKLGGLLLSMVLLVWTFNTSSLYNFMSLTSTSALSTQLFEETEKRRETLEGVEARARASGQLMPFVASEAAYYCPLAEREEATGLLSGSRGGGVVTATLTGLCLEAQNAEAMLAASIAAGEQGAAQASAALRAMGAAIEATDRPVFERERQWRVEAERFDAFIRSLRGSDMLASLETWVRTLKSSVQAMPTAGGALGETQNAALAGLRGRLEERIPPIEALVAELRGADLPEMRREPPPSLAEVTWAQADANLPALAVALGVDSAAFVLFLFFLLAEKPAARTPRRLEEMTVRTPGLSPSNNNRRSAAQKEV